LSRLEEIPGPTDKPRQYPEIEGRVALLIGGVWLVSSPLSEDFCSSDVLSFNFDEEDEPRRS
jgi:hypothetical protein